MATAREIRRRIRSVKNIGQITRALEAVSASRVRRAQARVLASRAYANKAWEILLNVQSTVQKGTPLHPLLTEREEIKRVMMILVTSERGLAGAYNTNVIRVAQQFAERIGKPVDVVTVGRKGRDAMVRAGANVIAEFSLPSEPTTRDISPVARLAIDSFLSGQVDDVFIAYTDFVNTLTQRPVAFGWLPLIPHDLDENVLTGDYIKSVPQVTTGKLDYEYEPNPLAILDEIVPRFTELMLYQAVLEAQASEHSARMVAMRNASDNAAQLVEALTLVYNKARQAAITSEILDIVGGAEALQASIDSLAEEILLQHQQQVLADKPAPRAASSTVGSSGQAPAAAAVAEAEPPAGEPEDLTVIEGIGPKMSSALIAAGITTYAQLAAATEDDLRAAIEAAGMRFSPSLVTWAEQAAYAARGDWDGLKALQDTLSAGRKA